MIFVLFFFTSFCSLLSLVVVKMIKEDNWVDTNKLYLTLHKAENLHSKKCKREALQGKEQGIRKNKEKISDWPGYRVCLLGLRKNKEMSIEPRVGLIFGWLDRRHFRSSGAFRTQKLPRLEFANQRHPRQQWAILGLESNLIDVTFSYRFMRTIYTFKRRVT